ncbi:AtpZ/AtpI family protein [Inquilinus sp.]
MTQNDQNPPPPLSDFDRRLQQAKAKLPGAGREKGGNDGRDVGRAGMAAGFRIAVELLAAIVVGAGIGWGLDQWLGTRPWLLILFFILGAVAGLMNVYRTGVELDRAAKAKRAADQAERNRGGR